MFIKEWQILVVDDEPDVLKVSELALRDVRIYDAPIRINTATSKAEALEKIAKEFTLQAGATNLAVAFIDVVMETDQAGLELCQVIREEMKNFRSQLYIRTGQPGVAPERSVIDRYEINGYFSKVEMTEDKLYSLVKSGVRQFSYIGASYTLSRIQTMLVQANGSQARMTAILNQVIQALESGAQGDKKDTQEINVAFFVGNDLIAGKNLAADIKTRLQSKLDSVPDQGGYKAVVDGHQMLIHVPPSDDTAEFSEVVDSPSMVAVA